MATKILREYGVESKMDKYNLMIARGGNLMDYNGQKIEVRAYMLVEEERDEGEIMRAFKCITTDNEVLGTNSPVFIRGLETYLDFMESDELGYFIPVQKPTRNNKKCLTFSV